ncbi:exopolysaccharide biosynthesis protein [Roseovarius sp. MMSF_3281]|uniref:exopolysaccharide biosynthesis protein n=1 Tax=Roseovarius sp. MMSF_3281 TaxID=3046694 RepID=UPI00273D8E76|nr:exopolysaccharide biosynthesis protein [Roseovarius sp. MMSF_3281]
MTATVHPQTASDVLRDAQRALNGDTMSIGELVEALGVASYTPLVLLPALALVSPLSGVPGFTTVCGLMIAIVSLQQMMERPKLWLPGWVRRASVATHKARKGMSWLMRPVRCLDRVTQRRLHGLVTPPVVRFPQGICFGLGAIMPVLEVIPFSSSIAGAIIAVLTTGIFMGDGLLVMIGLLVAAAIAGGLVVLF